MRSKIKRERKKTDKMQATSSNAANMDPATATALARKLVQTVARAFYKDSYIIVLDALAREKFIVYEEIAPRLRMSPKEVNGILANLEETECLIRSQNVTFHGATWKCYYIDYQAFVNIVRYRVYLMDQVIKKKEADLTNMMFECPTCSSSFTELESMKLLTKDNKRACPHCCPQNATFASIISEDFYRLREANMKDTNQSVRRMQEKFKDQLTDSTDHEGKLTDDHAGILNLLADLKDVPLLKNLPSDNIDRGLLTSRVSDAEQKLEMDEKTKAKYRASRGEAPQALSERQNESGGFRVQISTGDRGMENSSNSVYSSSSSSGVTKAMPDFLVGSGVKGTQKSYQQAHDASKLASASDVQKEAASDDDDDIAWES